MSTFVVYGKPVPQGSMRGYVRGGHVVLTSDNKKLKPWRQEVAGTALAHAMEKIGKHIPVLLEVSFYLEKPKSVAKARTWPAVKPDLDKLIRAIKDALKGIAFEDDGQVCRIVSSKHYGVPERTEITVTAL